MGNVVSYRYDANGNIVTNRTDGELVDLPGGAGNVRLAETGYSYDAMDRETNRTTAFFDTLTGTPIGSSGQAVARTLYTPNSKVYCVIDALGNGRTNIYDPANRLSLATDAKGNTLTYAYDGNGNVVTLTSTEKSDLGNPPQVFSSASVYDGMDRLVSATDNM